MNLKQHVAAPMNRRTGFGAKTIFALAMVAVLALVMVLGGTAVNAQGRSFTPAILASNDCTVEVSAGQSIAGAISAAPSGAIVCVREGVYNEQIRLGAAQNGLTLKAYPGEQPVLDGQGILPTLRYSGLIQIGSANNITVEGFEVRNSAERGVVITAGEGSAIDTHSITVRNLYVHHSMETGIMVKGNSALGIYNILVENNIVYQNLQKNIASDNGGSALVFVQTRDSEARGNTVYNNHGEGIVADRYATNTLIKNNVAYDNDHANIYVLNTINPIIDGNFVFCTDDRTFWNGPDRSGPLKAGVGLQLRDEYFPPYEQQPPLSRGQVIINNIVTGCSTNFGVATQVTGGGLTDAIVANNTFANARGDTGIGVNNLRLAGDATYANTLFVNNVVVQNTAGDIVRVLMSLGTPDLSTLTVANNLYWPSAPGSTWYPNEPGRLVADPLIANLVLPQVASLPNPAWYGLTANSPAINAGQIVTEVAADFFGETRSAPPDRGAIEFVAQANPGRILVAAEASPSGTAPLFSFTASFPPADFQLGAGQTHDSGPLDAGTYSVAMTPFPGWDLTSVVCSDGSPANAISIEGGETVTCTYSVTQVPQTGTIIVTVETDPDGAAEQFTFSSNYAADFQLSDGQSKATADLAAGVYNVQVAALSGWSQTSVTCSDGSGPAAIDLSAGETVTCTFVNTRQQPQTGTIIVRKETAPDGATQAFTFTASYAEDFQLSDGQSNTAADLPAGNYSVQEMALSGWDQTSATCDDGSDPIAIDLAANETVTCTFVNAEEQQPLGTIVVLKETVPNREPDSFAFTTTFGNDFSLADGQIYTSGQLGAGTYTVSEASVEGWTLTSATCDDGSDPAAIDLAGGETVTCTFVNTKDSPATGTIIVRKETDPAGATEQFTFSPSYGPDFQLGDDQTNTSAPLAPGTYSVVEAATAGWTLSSATCDDGSQSATIDLAAGETVTCTFRNKEDARSSNTEVLYISARQPGTVDGISYAYNDILALDLTTNSWSLYLDLSDVGIVRNLNGFTLMDDGSVLLTLNRNQSIDGLGTVTSRDVVRFIPQAVGPTTEGTWQWYLDGSDVGLTTNNEIIDTIAIAPDGRLVLSTTDTAIVPTSGGNLKVRDEDLMVFTPTSLGTNTTGVWSLYFDGSTVKGLAVEDINGAWLDNTNSDLYLTVTNSFNIGGVRGNGRDIIRLRPAGGTYQVQKYWYGPAYGFTGLPNAFVIKR